MLFVTYTFMAPMPLMAVAGCIAFTVAFWADKLFMTRLHRRPPFTSTALINAVVDMLPVSAILHVGLAAWVVGTMDLQDTGGTRLVATTLGIASASPAARVLAGAAGGSVGGPSMRRLAVSALTLAAAVLDPSRLSASPALTASLAHTASPSPTPWVQPAPRPLPVAADSRLSGLAERHEQGSHQQHSVRSAHAALEARRLQPNYTSPNASAGTPSPTASPLPVPSPTFGLSSNNCSCLERCRSFLSTNNGYFSACAVNFSCPTAFLDRDPVRRELVPWDRCKLPTSFPLVPPSPFPSLLTHVCVVLVLK